MKPDIARRTAALADYIIETGATVRSAAARFGISKSTVHKDMTERLRELNPGLWQQVRDVLIRNKSERHIRGGEATRKKYRMETAKQEGEAALKTSTVPSHAFPKT